ncbi:Ckb, partial [Symbiodinium sp. KB8]
MPEVGSATWISVRSAPRETGSLLPDLVEESAERSGGSLAATWQGVPAFYENARSTYPLFALEEDAGVAARLNPFAAFDGTTWPRVLLVLTAVVSLGIARCCEMFTRALSSTLGSLDMSFTTLGPVSPGGVALYNGEVPGGWSVAVASWQPMDACTLASAWIYIDAGYGKVVQERGDWSLGAAVPALAVYLRAPAFTPLLRLDAALGGCLLRAAGAAAAWAELLVGPAMIAAALHGGCWVQALPFLTVMLLHAGIGASMEGGFAIALVALATWAALLPGAFWEALGLAVRDGGRLAKGQALTTKPLLGGVAKGTPQEELGMLLGAVEVVTPGTRSQIQSDTTEMKRSHEAMVGEGEADEVFRAEPPSVTFVVLGPSGQEIGRFRLPRQAQALELKQAVEESTGLPRETQQVLIGHRRVEDEEMLLAGGDTPDLAEVEATLLVQLPVPTTRLEVQWKQLPETYGYLEELRVLNLERAGRRGWPPKEVLVPTARMGCVGIDPESGLLVLVGGGLPEHFGRRNGARYGYDSGEGSDSFHASELEDADGDKKRPSGTRVEYLPFSWKPGYRRQHPARRRNYEERCYSFRNSARNSLLVMPADSPAFSLPLDGHDPLVTAVEMHAMSSLQGYPFPSVGLAVALATGSRRKFAGPLQLIACELSPVTARTVCLTPADADCQAVCLDRGKEVAISAEVHSDGTYIGFYRLRPCQAASAERLRAEVGSCGKRATSIAWSEPANAVLLTFAGEHAIYVYQRVGAAWQPLQTLGDASSRGCQDGPASELRFWFPCGDCRLLQGPYGSLMKDSFPLLPGPGGAIYVHSGGALLLLAADLTSARKITSMREELWLTEDDEGSTVDLWSWQPVSFAEPRYGDEWNGAHEVKVLKYQFFELFADLGGQGRAAMADGGLPFASLPGLGDTELEGFPADRCPEQMPDLSRHFSITADVLKEEPALYDAMRSRQTPMGVTFAKCIKTGMDNRGHPMIKTLGAVAGDADCYDTFQPFFDKLISSCFGQAALERPHLGSPKRFIPAVALADPSYVVSSHLRVSRNVQGLRFVPSMLRSERAEVERMLVKALLGGR